MYASTIVRPQCFWSVQTTKLGCFHALKKHAAIFVVVATVKTRHVLKKAWQGLSTKGCKKLKGQKIMIKKLCFRDMI